MVGGGVGGGGGGNVIVGALGVPVVCAHAPAPAADVARSRSRYNVLFVKDVTVAAVADASAVPPGTQPDAASLPDATASSATVCTAAVVYCTS